MGERVSLVAKKCEPEKENSVSRIRKDDSSRSIKSPVEQIMFLQSTVGNRAVQRLVKSGSLQAKLKIGQSGDIYEQEADRVADAVLQMPQAIGRHRSEPSIQRLCTSCEKKKLQRQQVEEDEEKLRKQSIEEDKEKNLRAKEIPGNSAGTTPDIESSILQIRGEGKSLSETARAYFEPRFGYDFSQVRVHAGSQANKLAQAVNARAFTIGSDVVFGEGQYSPDTGEGRKLIAHELTHVLQQSTTNPTIQRMPACPPSWPDPIPPGWQRYHGNPNVFHCGFRGILENRIPTPDNPQNECFYDHSGALVDQNHPYAGCRGTPNQYDSNDSPVSHTLRDTGGILYAGPEAFITSRVYDITQSIAGAIRIVQTVGTTAGTIAGSIADALGQAIALGVLSAKATVDPINWRFQGLPSRSIRHLNVIGGILSSTAWDQDPNRLLTNITRRLDSFPISGLIDEITEDINQALRSHDPNALQARASDIGTLSLLQLIDWLHSQGLIQYVRQPEDIAREGLNASRRQ